MRVTADSMPPVVPGRSARKELTELSSNNAKHMEWTPNRRLTGSIFFLLWSIVLVGYFNGHASECVDSLKVPAGSQAG